MHSSVAPTRAFHNPESLPWDKCSTISNIYRMLHTIWRLHPFHPWRLHKTTSTTLILHQLLYDLYTFPSSNTKEKKQTNDFANHLYRRSNILMFRATFFFSSQTLHIPPPDKKNPIHIQRHLSLPCQDHPISASHTHSHIPPLQSIKSLWPSLPILRNVQILRIAA